MDYWLKKKNPLIDLFSKFKKMIQIIGKLFKGKC